MSVKKKNLSSLSCQLAAEKLTPQVAMIALFCRIGFLDGQENRKTKEPVSMPAGPEAKESPGFFDLMAFDRTVVNWSLSATPVARSTFFPVKNETW